MKTKTTWTMLVMLLGLFVWTQSASAFYNPQTGRWLSRDPIEEGGGPNLYAFCDNDDYNTIDALGLACLERVTKKGKPKYVFTTEPPRGGWKGAVKFKYKAGSSGTRGIQQITVVWKAQVTAACRCPSGCVNKEGTKVYKAGPEEGTWVIYDPTALPLGVPVVTGVAQGILKLFQAAVLRVASEDASVAMPSVIDEITSVVLSMPAPATPWDGEWEKGKSPCAD